MTEFSENLFKTTRQVDVKALVSHIVRGDGLDKCRICMGDTSQGQVHLSDTVMMDGEKPVTLSELLEIITGVEVLSEEALPPAICKLCCSTALEAADFRMMVQNANHQWSNTTQLLEHVPDHSYSKRSDRVCAILCNNDIYITDSYTDNPENVHSVDDEEDDDSDYPFKRVGKKRKCSCPSCGKKFSYPLLLYKHLKESPDAKRACHICAEIMNRDKLANHLFMKHLTESFSCEKCPALFLIKSQFREHMSKAHTGGATTCGDCGRAFKTAPAFRAHQGLHELRSCPNCDTPFRNRPCYLHHVRKCCSLDKAKIVNSKMTIKLPKKQNRELKMGMRGGTNIKECICDYCQKKFAGKKYVAAHIQIVHTKDTHRPCTHCGKLFAKAHMTSHLKSHQARAFECEQCGIVLKSKLGLSQHLRLHTGEKPYACEICGETFVASSRRSEHMFSAHSESRKPKNTLKHKCSFCQAQFRLPSMLKKHIKMHTGVNQEEWEWECGKCNKKFESYSSLSDHILQHTS